MKVLTTETLKIAKKTSKMTEKIPKSNLINKISKIIIIIMIITQFKESTIYGEKDKKVSKNR